MLSCSTCARRVALHGYGDKIIEHACTNHRSLINFGDVPNFNTFGALRVLHTSSSQYIRLEQSQTNLLKDLNSLTALKYIGLEGEVAHFCRFRTGCFFKRSPVTYRKNIQTVHTLVCTSHGKLPRSFWDNKQLRHINLSSCPWWYAAPQGPPSAADLQSLLTLKGVKARQEWVKQLPNFPYIRKLGILIPDDVARQDWEPLINLLSKLNDLGSLYLKTRVSYKTKHLAFPDCFSAFRNHNRLHSFNLDGGIWPKEGFGDCTLFPPQLVKLTLQWFICEEDPMPQLEKFPNLRILKLYCSSYIEDADVKQMICSRGGFGRLQRLILWVNDLEEWKIEDGSMSMLNQLVLIDCWHLEVPDLQYLTNLQEFSAEGCSGLKSRLQGEDQWKIKHIPSVMLKAPW